MKKIVTLGMVLLILLGTASSLEAKKKKIEEDHWNIHITPDAGAAAKGEKVTTDTLILQQGFLRLKGGDDHGFGTSPYTLNGSTITAQTKSNYEGIVDWTANWTGDTIAGRMVWTQKDGTVFTYTFSGNRAPVQKAKKHKS